MKWKTFLQIILLSIVVGVIFYRIYPKYDLKVFIHPREIIRVNKITGKTMVVNKDNQSWREF